MVTTIFLANLLFLFPYTTTVYNLLELIKNRCASDVSFRSKRAACCDCIFSVTSWWIMKFSLVPFPLSHIWSSVVHLWWLSSFVHSHDIIRFLFKYSVQLIWLSSLLQNSTLRLTDNRSLWNKIWKRTVYIDVRMNLIMPTWSIIAEYRLNRGIFWKEFELECTECFSHLEYWATNVFVWRISKVMREKNSLIFKEGACCSWLTSKRDFFNLQKSTSILLYIAFK